VALFLCEKKFTNAKKILPFSHFLGVIGEALGMSAWKSDWVCNCE
jgi:hypothetical protein